MCQKTGIFCKLVHLFESQNKRFLQILAKFATGNTVEHCVNFFSLTCTKTVTYREFLFTFLLIFFSFFSTSKKYLKFFLKFGDIRPRKSLVYGFFKCAKTNKIYFENISSYSKIYYLIQVFKAR